MVSSSSSLLTLIHVYKLLGLVFSSIALGLRGQILVTSNFDIILHDLVGWVNKALNRVCPMVIYIIFYGIIILDWEFHHYLVVLALGLWRFNKVFFWGCILCWIDTCCFNVFSSCLSIT
jgi:hypothetical protein